MFCHLCGKDRPPASSVPPLESIKFAVVDKTTPDGNGTTDKAVCTKDGKIEVARAWWSTMTHAQKAAVLGHEAGHASGIDCEPCCDRYCGYAMRKWGFTRPGIKAAYAVRAGHGRAELADEGAAHAEARGFDSTYQLSGAGSRYAAPHGTSGAGIDTLLRAKALATSSPRGALKIAAPPTLTKPATSTPPPPGAPTTPAPVANQTQTTNLASAHTLDPGGPGSSNITPAPAGTQTPFPVGGDTEGQLTPNKNGDPNAPPIATAGDPTSQLLSDFGLGDVKVDKSGVVNEVIAGVIVAVLVFVIFRFGGAS